MTMTDDQENDMSKLLVISIQYKFLGFLQFYNVMVFILFSLFSTSSFDFSLVEI